MIQVRPARSADLDGLVSLWQALADRGSEADPRWRVHDDAAAAMRAYFKTHWFGRFLPFPAGFVAADGDALVGFVAGTPSVPPAVIDQPPTARIGDLFVLPSHRRQGLARRLVEAFCSAATAGGYPHIEVGTLTHDARAVAFWRAMGFGDWMVLLRRDPD